MASTLSYSHKRTVEPAVRPVTLAEMKSRLGVAAADDDDALRSLINTATNQVEKATRRALITQTWVLSLDGFPDVNHIELPRSPCSSVTSVQYVDGAGATQTFSSSLYTVDTNSEPGLVRLNYGESWPSHRGDERGVVITYLAGYGATADSVPEPLRHAILLGVEMAYDCPDSHLQMAYDAVVNSWRVGTYP